MTVELANNKGQLVCVGIGMTLGAHLTPLARRHIEEADVVFTATSDGVIELWLAKMHRDVRSLQPFYKQGRSRAQTYREMVEAIMQEVRAGRRVCGAFYGHPGVFATTAHKAIESARREGFAAYMEPGISAADCLYADLGIDPGRVGCQHFEATQFLMFRRRIDSAAYLILWQVGVAGDQSLKRFATTAAHRQVLIDVLMRDYAPDHEVILYEAATLPTQRARIARLALRELAHVEVSMHATLIVPPSTSMEPDVAIRERLAALDSPEQGERMSTAEDPTIESDRLTMRSLSSTDESFYCSLYTDTEVMRFVGAPLARQSAQEAFRKSLELMSSASFQRRVVVLIDRKTQQPVGLSSVRLVNAKLGRAEVGTLLKPEAQEQGFAIECSEALIAQAFTRPQINELLAYSASGNSPIQRLLQELGFKRGRVRAADKGRPERVAWLLTRADWSNRRGDKNTK